MDEDEPAEEDAIVRRPWSSAEEVALTKAYLHASETKKHGNQQKRDMLWRRVIAHFEKLPDATDRNMDKMTSKWGDLNRKISKFNACYIQLSRDPQSGASEATIIKNALSNYIKIFRYKSFPHLDAWEIARHHPKWEPVLVVDMDGPTAPSKK
ncbi:glutathione S-transferase T3-like [Bidens hawaiensis]|uniref:glutathione S-transferase T3-like n=1 Tax=Bidens hawaiensis TaxID=980011 RepID=UPI004049DB59